MGAMSMVVAAWFVGTAAGKEHELHPGASGVAIPHVLAITPWEIDVTDPDFTVVFDLRNDAGVPLVVAVQGARCLRGELDMQAHGRPRPLRLDPYETRRVKLRCDHGGWVTGDFGFVLPEVAVDGGDHEVLATEVTWKLREKDVVRSRQRHGEGLACLTYRRPAPEPEPIATPEPVAATVPAPPPPVAAPEPAPPPAAPVFVLVVPPAAPTVVMPAAPAAPVVVQAPAPAANAPFVLSSADLAAALAAQVAPASPPAAAPAPTPAAPTPAEPAPAPSATLRRR